MRKLLLSIVAGVAALFMPLAATSQIAPDRGAAPEKGEPSYKYEAFAGYGYTSLNQVDQSRNGLQGFNLAITRDFGKYYGVTADGASYKYSLDATNPGNPIVDTVLFGPVLHGNFYDRVDGFMHVLLGGEHTGGEVGGTPKVSFAAGIGVGMDYRVKPQWAVRLSGDDIRSSFVADPNHLGYSPHEHANARLAVGIVYKFGSR